VNSAVLHVTVVYSPQPRVLHEVVLALPAPCTVGAAIAESGLAHHFPGINDLASRVGVWSRTASLQESLRDRDRIEVYRPLRVDPKVARRERFVKQGARSAGLFAKNRLGKRAAD